MFDTEKYVNMLKTDNHTNVYIHKIVKLLKETKNKYTLKQASMIIGIPIEADKKLLNALKENNKIIFEDDTIRLKHEFNFQNKEEFLETISDKKYEFGIEMRSLEDSPLDIENIVNECLKERSIVFLKTIEGNKIIFYNSLKTKEADESTKDLYQSIKITSYPEMLKELRKLGLSKKEEIQVQQPVVKAQPKKKRQRRQIKITNTHIKDFDLNDF